MPHGEGHNTILCVFSAKDNSKCKFRHSLESVKAAKKTAVMLWLLWRRRRRTEDNSTLYSAATR